MDPKPADHKGPAELDQCSLKELSEEEQKAFEQVIESLAGPSDEEFQKKFQELVMTAGEAANAGRDEEAQQAAMTMLLMSGARALKDPGPDVTLANEASRCESAGDWAGAEAARRKLLALREQEGRAGMTAKALLDLSRLLRLLGRLDEAWSYACAASEAARREDLAPLTVMTLENQALCALDRKDVPGALEAAERALSLVKPERIQNQMRMRTLILRAQVLVESGDATGAERDLGSACELESELPFARMGGALMARARRWEIQAELHVRQGDLTQASESLAQAIALRREAGGGCCATSPYVLVVRACGLERFADISRQLGNVAAEREAFSEAKALRDQAHLPLTSR
jgi:tetratricopeptide (TPR) repeat protein